MPGTNRKKAILDAAVDLFADNGFSAASTLAVAKKAGVAEGLIFHYFKSKKGILIHILDEIYQLYVTELEKILSQPESGLRIVEKMALCHFDLRATKIKEFQVLSRDIPSGIMDPDSPEYKKINRHINDVLKIFRQAILIGQKDGSIRTGAPDEMALMVRGALLGISSLGQRLYQKPIYRNLSEEVARFIRRGIGTGMEGV